MMRCQRLEHRFVQYVPEKLEPGVLYIALEFCTASHICCCGCGEEVVTPLSPAQWRMTFDGETVSLWPSIGNWSLRCRSHYVIDHGRVLTAPPWSDTQIEAGRQRDRDARAQHYGTPPNVQPAPQLPPVPQPQKVPTVAPEEKKRGRWSRFWKWIFGT
ncbi:hypothetical protein GobsT_25340 [Gemmata obscuriglobus]|uniref:Uncharacterized protein n=1 Tax=Gemmata obscuriglobus TaxID=114 RepID=A0A2Z3H2U4_9BACT|nr:DUF6527 family protein [Gemmata obscuriglobus]AWM39181.1 hypothetical protein C1280_20780 [Gemmata obscuriglobus]QEG27770.1 hypothetical protein GobsT_25340 [Gemmata obscuriglobus]VTS05066.1 Uncharacterized protein OS=Rhizobium sp. IRBG74 GN=BN877_p0042 PE=4 SV=1 [Gemmata obscuriglobus UQM 2246]